MKRSTWVLLGAVLILGAVILLWERQQPSTDERAESQNHLVALDAATVTSLKRTGFQPLKIVKDKDRWNMLSPVRDRTDSYTVEGFLERVSGAEITRNLKEGPEAEGLGLNPARATWTIETAGGPVVLHVGRKAPFDEGLYVESGGTVALLPAGLESLFLKPAEDFRLKELTFAATQTVERCSVSGPGGLSLAFKRSGEDSWTVTRPYEDWGDGSKLQDLLDDVSLCPVFSFTPEAAPGPPEYGLSHPGIRIHLFLKGGRKTDVLLGNPVPGSDPKKKLVYAWATGRPTVMAVSQNSLASLTQDPETYRSLDCFRHSLFESEGVEVSGLRSIKLSRDAKRGWRFTEPKNPPKGADAATLAAGLSGLKASRIARPGAAERLGRVSYTVALTGPSFRETLTIYPTADGATFARPGGRKVALVLDKKPWERAEAALNLTGKGTGTAGDP